MTIREMRTLEALPRETTTEQMDFTIRMICIVLEGPGCVRYTSESFQDSFPFEFIPIAMAAYEAAKKKACLPRSASGSVENSA